MEKLVESWNEFHGNKIYRYLGVIKLCLGKEQYFLEIGVRRLNLLFYIDQLLDLSFFCSFEDWVKLLSGRLSSLWGIISGCLR